MCRLICDYALCIRQNSILHGTAHIMLFFHLEDLSLSDRKCIQINIFLFLQPTSQAQSDVNITGDQGVAGLLSIKYSNIVSGEIMKVFLRSFSPFNPGQGRQHSFIEIDDEIFSSVILSLPLIQEEQLSVSGVRKCTNTG